MPWHAVCLVYRTRLGPQLGHQWQLSSAELQQQNATQNTRMERFHTTLSLALYGAVIDEKETPFLG